MWSVAASETSVILTGMRVLPTCSEGFRRLALIAALVTAPVMFAHWFINEGKRYQSEYALCGDIYLTESQNCALTDHACTEVAFKQETACLKGLQTPFSDHLETWGLFAVGALLAAYFAALVVRTIGWVVQGFQKHA